MIDPYLALLGLITMTGVSFFFSGFETGIYALNRVRLTMRLSEGDPSAQRVERLFSRPTALIAVILIGNNVVNFAVTWFGRELVLGMGAGGGLVDVWNTVLLTPLLFVFGEMTPKNCFRQRADRWVYATSGVLIPLLAIVEPVSKGIARLGALLPRRGVKARRDPSTEAWSRSGIELLVLAGAEEGVLSGDEGRMVQNILGLDRVQVRDVLVPLDSTKTLPETATAGEISALAVRHHLVQVPIWRDRPDQIVGVVELYSLVGLAPGDRPTRVRPVSRIEADASVKAGLRALRGAGGPVGIVVEEEAVIGILSLRRLLEAIL